MTAKPSQRGSNPPSPRALSRSTASTTTKAPPPERIAASPSAARVSARRGPHGAGRGGPVGVPAVGRLAAEADREQGEDRRDDVPARLDPRRDQGQRSGGDAG